MQPTRDDVQAAAQRIVGHAHRTPVLTSKTLDEQLGCQVFIKAEHLQRAGAFKFRGAINTLSLLDPDQRRRGVVAFSSGNHAQAVALAARELGISATVVMPTDAPAMKAEATRRYGATVVTYDRRTENRAEIAAELAERTGGTVVPPFDHGSVVAGAGTAALELMQDVGELDALVAPVGGGGLLAGTALAASDQPSCAVYGVEPAAGNDVQQSLAAGHPVSIEVPDTIADGAQTTRVGDHTFPIIQRLVAGIWTVSDRALITEMQFMAARLKQLVEPTGCLALAGLRAHAAEFASARVGVIVSGGNTDLARFAGFLAS